MNQLVHNDKNREIPMARPREFDTHEALSGALDVFWTLGYENASLPDLLNGMELTRGSFYKAFKDKKSLFLEIMKRYELEAVEPAVALLTNNQIKDGQERIERLFNSVVEAVRNGDKRGCLLCSTVAASTSLEKEISQYANELLDKLRQGFATAISDSTNKNLNPDATANLLITQYIGLRILARSGSTTETLDKSVGELNRLLTQ